MKGTVHSLRLIFYCNSRIFSVNSNKGKKITIENDFHKKVISKKGRELQEIRIQKTISKEEKEDFKVQIRNQTPSVQNNSTNAAKEKISSDSGKANRYHEM